MTIVLISIKILVIMVADLSNSTFTYTDAFMFTGNTSMPPVCVNDMPDGLSIQGTEQLRAVTATWDVFVTLDAPPYPSMLARQVDALDQTLLELEALKTVGIELDLSPHRLRRDSLRAMLDLHPRPSRSKRSLLGAGGFLMHLILASANVSTHPAYDHLKLNASIDSANNASLTPVFPQNYTWPNTTWSTNASLNLTPSYWQWEPSTGSYHSLMDAGSSLLHALFGLNKSLEQTTHAPTEAPLILRSAPSSSASNLLTLLFGLNASSAQMTSNSIWGDSNNNHSLTNTASVSSPARNVNVVNASHTVRLAHDVMPKLSILHIGTSLVKHLFSLPGNTTDNLADNETQGQLRVNNNSLLNVGSSLMEGLFGLRNSTKLRGKRGLLDVGGSILHHLFGVATSSQLNRYRLAMQEVKGQQADTMHAYVSLASVVNQTRAYAKQLALRQRQLVLHAQELTTAIQLLTKTSQSQQRQIQQVKLLTDLDRFLDVLD